MTNPSSTYTILVGGGLKIMKEYSEADKVKYCRGFKNCTLPITDYAVKMGIPVEELKVWLKEYKEPLAYGAIDLTSLFEQQNDNSTKANFKFNTDTIKIEITEGYDRNVLKKILELGMWMCNVK